MITDTQFVAQSFPALSRTRKEISPRHYVEGKPVYFACKRVFDIVISALVILLLLSWLIPLLAVLIKSSSGGPVFFLQKRVGRFGRSFTCIKFRTMIVNSEADRRQASENDGRITRIGNFLRKSNIDELPQFFNVLMGDMSIVGPRPHMHADCRRFSTIVPRYKFRSLVKPGITGISQIKGYHGQVVSTECIFQRYQWDVFYVRNAGFWWDMKIVGTTAVQRVAFMISSLFVSRAEMFRAKAQRRE
jgi:putative colanic acid biosynthesis UDP-glucose lipid carrier transferase